MPRSPKRLLPSQLTLFHPVVRTPDWNTLPMEVRCRVLSLLARLLREVASRDCVADPVGGRSDE